MKFQFPDVQQYSHLSKSNAPPSRSEELSLRTIRSEILVSLKKVKASVKEARTKLQSLEAQEIRLEKMVAEYSVLLAPIRRLPQDVLLNIFRELQPTWPKDLFNLTTGPWKLAQVCSHWRSIAYDDPSFWSVIHIDIGSRIPKHFLSIVCTVLQRTKSADLDITFISGCEIPYGSVCRPRLSRHTLTKPSPPEDNREREATELNANSKRIPEILCTYSYRWRSFNASIPMDHWECFRQIEGTLSKLERLAIGVVNRQRFNADNECTFFAGSPKLKSVALGIGSFLPPNRLSLADTVTELSVNLDSGIGPHLDKVIPPAMNKLTLHGDGPGYHGDSKPDPPSFPSIKFLCAEGDSLDYLTLPNLEELHLSNWTPRRCTIPQIAEFLHRSIEHQSAGRYLPKLIISPGEAIPLRSTQEALSLLSPFSSLRSLTLDASSLSRRTSLHAVIGHLLRALTLSNKAQLQSASPLPHLTELIINFANHNSAPTRELVHEVIQSRKQPPKWFTAQSGGCKLQKFHYTDAEHKSLSILTYDLLLLPSEEELECI